MLAPLKHVRVWRFSLYYVVVFGAYVALSAWLPNYYRNTFGVDLRTAALLTALYIFTGTVTSPKLIAPVQIERGIEADYPRARRALRATHGGLQSV